MSKAAQLLVVGATAAGLTVAAPVQAEPSQTYRFQADHVLGTSFALTVTGVEAARAEAMRDAALDEIERLNAVLSGWRPDSELARLNAAKGPRAVSADLYRVIDACEGWRARTGGAFSARSGLVEAAWRKAEAAGAAPEAERLAALCGEAEAAAVRLDSTAGTIDRGGATFAVDALAKGYIVDAALAAALAAAPEARGALIDIGGDLRCFGAAPGGGAWRIGLAAGGEADNLAPAQIIAVGDRAVATSGPGARDLSIEGCAVNHTRSPITGQPAARRTVTVVAGLAAEADALATALGVMPVDQGLALAQGRGASARIVEPGQPERATADWSSLLSPAVYDAASSRPPLLRTAGMTQVQNRAWPAGFSVEVDYEIPRPPAGRARAPYVAIWITDASGKIVRTLYHLGAKGRFLDSNYVWFNAMNQVRGDVVGVTRPSRPPGKYSAVWDGKDDRGAALPQGRYTINVEMSREHGGHSLQAMTLTLGAAPATASAAAQSESGPASVSYGRRADGAAT